MQFNNHESNYEATNCVINALIDQKLQKFQK